MASIFQVPPKDVMTSFVVKGLPPGGLFPILRSHGWIDLAPACPTDNGCMFSLSLPSGIAVTITLADTPTGARCSCDTTLSRTDASLLARIVGYMLSLDFDLSSFEQMCRDRKDLQLLKLASQGWGRMFRSPCLWEDAAKTLFTTNASWSHTQHMCNSLCKEFGERTPSGRRTFPAPAVIKVRRLSTLISKAGVGYRAISLKQLAERFSLQNHDWLATARPEDAEQEVLSWHGFGKYAARHLLVLAGHHCFLPVDREVSSFLGTRKVGEPMPKEDAGDFAEWGDYRFTAYKLARVARNPDWIEE